MTKEKGEIPDSFSSDPWEVTEEVKRMARDITKKMAEREAEFEKQVIDCPECNSPSKFLEYRGAYTRVRGVFRCENGHEFFVG